MEAIEPASRPHQFNAAAIGALAAEAGFALASELANARDLQELVTLQSNYAQKQMKLYALQTQELGRLMTEALRNTQPGKSPG